MPMKRKLLSCSYKIYTLTCTIPKFESTGVKLVDFSNAQSWAILLSKMVRGLGRVLC